MVVLGIPKVAAPVDNAGNFTSEVGWALCCGCHAKTFLSLDPRTPLPVKPEALRAW